MAEEARNGHARAGDSLVGGWTSDPFRGAKTHKLERETGKSVMSKAGPWDGKGREKASAGVVDAVDRD